MSDKKLITKHYNVTDLDPQTTFERHVFHRDQFAHYFRWTHILKEAKKKDIICDFWCWNGNLWEVLYRNRVSPKKYIWIDIREKTINKAKEYFAKVNWMEFIAEDLIKNTRWVDFSNIKADKVCSFEVLEHVWLQNVPIFLKNFKACWNKNATYYLSTPKFDDKVWAAWNHTYDSWDWRWVDRQEISYNELHDAILDAWFIIEKTYWTFASIKDYKHLMNESQLEMFEYLKDYYDVNILSNMMAPFFPEQSRNILWILKNK